MSYPDQQKLSLETMPTNLTEKKEFLDKVLLGANLDELEQFGRNYEVQTLPMCLVQCDESNHRLSKLLTQRNSKTLDYLLGEDGKCIAYIYSHHNLSYRGRVQAAEIPSYWSLRNQL